MPDPLDNASERAKKFLRQDPFLDGDGPNPFGDGEKSVPPDRPASNNPFATATDATGDMPPREYIATQQPRGALLLALGIGGLVVCVAGVMAMAFRSDIPGGLNWLPVPFIALAACVPAVTLSYADLLAMDAGAMEPTGWLAARTAFGCGLIGCVLAAAYALAIALVLLQWVAV